MNTNSKLNSSALLLLVPSAPCPICQEHLRPGRNQSLCSNAILDLAKLLCQSGLKSQSANYDKENQTGQEILGGWLFYQTILETIFRPACKTRNCQLFLDIGCGMICLLSCSKKSHPDKTFLRLWYFQRPVLTAAKCNSNQGRNWLCWWLGSTSYKKTPAWISYLIFSPIHGEFDVPYQSDGIWSGAALLKTTFKETVMVARTSWQKVQNTPALQDIRAKDA